MSLDSRQQKIAEKFQEIFDLLELDKEEWQKTAHRLAEIYLKEIFPEPVAAPSLQLYPQPGAKGQLIFLNKIPIHTFCQHHLVPMFGHAKIGYIPSKDAILGFSKVHELMLFFCQRPQLQETLTHKIAEALSHALESADVAICTRMVHTCIAQKKESLEASTIDSYYFSGFFKKEIYQKHFFDHLACKQTS